MELILRAFGLCYHLDEYEKPMKEFLSKIARKYQNTDSERLEIFTRDFIKAVEYIDENLIPKPFSIRGPLNNSIFDSIFCTILSNINALPDDLSERYDKLIKDEKFIEYTTLATTDAKIVKKRFEYVKRHLIDNDALFQ